MNRNSYRTSLYVQRTHHRRICFQARRFNISTRIDVVAVEIPASIKEPPGSACVVPVRTPQVAANLCIPNRRVGDVGADVGGGDLRDATPRRPQARLCLSYASLAKINPTEEDIRIIRSDVMPANG